MIPLSTFGYNSLTEPVYAAHRQALADGRRSFHEEYFESRATGVEIEGEDPPPSDDPEPWDPEKIRVHTKHYSLRQLMEMVVEGDIDLAPDFQRQYVWKPQQRSALIESLLLGIPLPSFYFNEDTSARLQVVDGVQRLTTIYRYLIDKSFSLGKVTYLHDLEGQGFDDLSPFVSPTTEQRTVRRPCNRPPDPGTGSSSTSSAVSTPVAVHSVPRKSATA